MTLGKSLYDHIPALSAIRPDLAGALRVTPTLAGSWATDATGSTVFTSTFIRDTEYLWADPSQGGGLIGTVEENSEGGITHRAADGNVVMSTAENGIGGQSIFDSAHQQVGSLQGTVDGSALLLDPFGGVEGSVQATLDGGIICSPNPCEQRKFEAPTLGMPDGSFGGAEMLSSLPDLASFDSLAVFPDLPAIDFPQLDAGMDVFASFDGVDFDADF